MINMYPLGAFNFLPGLWAVHMEVEMWRLKIFEREHTADNRDEGLLALRATAQTERFQGKGQYPVPWCRGSRPP